ncbi:hypothetical protein ACS0TY_015894 [Phlomoides rotata]
MTTAVMETATEDDGRFVSPTLSLSLSISRSEFQRRRRLNRPPTAPTHYRRLKKAATAEEDGGDGRFVCSFMEEEPKSVALTSLLSLSTPKFVALNPQIPKSVQGYCARWWIRAYDESGAYDEEKGGGSEIGSLTAVFVDREFDHRVRRSEIEFIIMASELNCSRTQPPVTPRHPRIIAWSYVESGQQPLSCYFKLLRGKGDGIWDSLELFHMSELSQRHPWITFYTDPTLKSLEPKKNPVTHGGLVDVLAVVISRVRISEPKRSRICSPARPIQQECSSNLKTTLKKQHEERCKRKYEESCNRQHEEGCKTEGFAGSIKVICSSGPKNSDEDKTRS